MSGEFQSVPAPSRTIQSSRPKPHVGAPVFFMLVSSRLQSSLRECKIATIVSSFSERHHQSTQGPAGLAEASARSVLWNSFARPRRLRFRCDGRLEAGQIHTENLGGHLCEIEQHRCGSHRRRGNGKSALVLSSGIKRESGRRAGRSRRMSGAEKHAARHAGSLRPRSSMSSLNRCVALAGEPLGLFARARPRQPIVVHASGRLTATRPAPTPDEEPKADEAGADLHGDLNGSERHQGRFG